MLVTVAEERTGGHTSLSAGGVEPVHNRIHVVKQR
jgi:hypothetical protein